MKTGDRHNKNVCPLFFTDAVTLTLLVQTANMPLSQKGNFIYEI